MRNTISMVVILSIICILCRGSTICCNYIYKNISETNMDPFYKSKDMLSVNSDIIYCEKRTDVEFKRKVKVTDDKKGADSELQTQLLNTAKSYTAKDKNVKLFPIIVNVQRLKIYDFILNFIVWTDYNLSNDFKGIKKNGTSLEKENYLLTINGSPNSNISKMKRTEVMSDVQNKEIKTPKKNIDLGVLPSSIESTNVVYYIIGNSAAAIGLGIGAFSLNPNINAFKRAVKFILKKFGIKLP